MAAQEQQFSKGGGSCDGTPSSSIGSGPPSGVAGCWRRSASARNASRPTAPASCARPPKSGCAVDAKTVRAATLDDRSEPMERQAPMIGVSLLRYVGDDSEDLGLPR